MIVMVIILWRILCLLVNIRCQQADDQFRVVKNDV